LILTGCSGEVRIESKPNELDPSPRLIIDDHSLRGLGPYIYIIKDTQNEIEYLVVKTGYGLSVCKMEPVKAELGN
jgi:hypothetical protein